jgi:hypothetical protein
MGIKKKLIYAFFLKHLNIKNIKKVKYQIFIIIIGLLLKKVKNQLNFYLYFFGEFL